nr:MAG TPA: hypothetical protein [Caudoviricetes sp.]
MRKAEKKRKNRAINRGIMVSARKALTILLPL